MRSSISPAKIRSLRVSLGLSQADMARRVGVTVLTYGRWERGECSPRGKNARDIAAILASRGSRSDREARILQTISQMRDMLDQLERMVG